MLYRAVHKAVWLVSIIVLSCTTQDGKHGYPVLGRDGLQNLAAVENHSEAFLRWAEQGVRGATLINFDAHDDIRWIPDEKIESLKKLYAKKDMAGLRKADSLSDEGLYNIGNWIYAAARLGIVSEVYWVAPHAHFTEMDADRLKNFLEKSIFPRSVIRTFRLQNGRFTGHFFGIPVTLCSLETLPPPDKPVLLTIDTDFLPLMSEQYNVDRLEAVNILFDFLYKRPYPVIDAVVAYSVEHAFTNVFDRYLGDEVTQLLKEPRILSAGPPELWLARRTVQTLLAQNKPVNLIRAGEQLLKRFPDEPFLLLHLASAHLGLGNPEQAFRYAEKICRADAGYCHGLTELGLRLAEAGNFSLAERFFQRAYELNPFMNSRQLSYAVALTKAGRYRQALVLFDRARRFFPSHRIDFLAGETHLRLGDENMALRCFERASASLKTAPYPEIPGGESTEAVKNAIRLYEKKGRKDDARELRKVPQQQVPD